MGAGACLSHCSDDRRLSGGGVLLATVQDHFNATEDPATKLGVFSTAPAIPNTPINLLCEVIATFVLVLGVLYIAAPDVGLGALDALPVALLVFGIGLGMGELQDMRSIPPEIWGRGWPMPYCLSKAKARITGAMRGCRCLAL